MSNCKVVRHYLQCREYSSIWSTYRSRSVCLYSSVTSGLLAGGHCLITTGVCPSVKHITALILSEPRKRRLLTLWILPERTPTEMQSKNVLISIMPHANTPLKPQLRQLHMWLSHQLLAVFWSFRMKYVFLNIFVVILWRSNNTHTGTASWAFGLLYLKDCVNSQFTIFSKSIKKPDWLYIAHQNPFLTIVM